MSNSTYSEGVAIADPVLAGPVLAIAVIIFVVLFAVVVVLVYKRNRQARIRRLRESVQLAARRLQTAIQLKQVTDCGYALYSSANHSCNRSIQSEEIQESYVSMRGSTLKTRLKIKSSNSTMIPHQKL